GVQIFERDRRGVRLTPAGEALVEQARRVLLAAGDLRELARHAADPFRGTLRIGAIPTVCHYLLPDIAPALARAFPALTVVWSEERTGRLVNQLQAGAIDAALLALGPEVGAFEHAVLGRDPFVLAAHPDPPLVRTRRPADPAVLNGATVLLLDDGHCLREQALDVCARAGAGEL